MALQDSIKPILDDLKRVVRINVSNAMDVASDYLVKQVSQVFPLQGARGDNPKWVTTGSTGLTLRATWPVKGSVSQKKKYLSSARTLIDTGALSKSIKVIGKEGNADTITRYISTGITSYRNLDKLEKGGEVTARSRNSNKRSVKLKLPERPMIFTTPQDEQNVMSQLRRRDFSEGW